MVDVVKLERRARATAEWARARMAVRVALPVVALTLIALATGSAPGYCAAGGVILFLVAAALRWRSQMGVDAVQIGLPLGTIPLGAGVVLQQAGVPCGSLPNLSSADLVCVLTGAIAGAGVTLWAARTAHNHLRRWPPAVLIASLTAMLGCFGLGVAGVLATLASLAMSSVLAWIPLAARVR
jgi:hypothetical protein